MGEMSKRWKDLSPATRRGITVIGVLDAGLRIWAVADLKSRADEDLKGPKALWGVALATVSSAGALPAAYFLLGRRPARH